MKKLKLKNLKQTYVKDENRQWNVYCNKDSNNAIILNPIYSDCNEYTITHGIAKDAYEYLINVLTNHTNITVHWFQISSTTSDYIIYYDLDIKDMPAVVISPFDALSAYSKEKISGYKYKEVKSGIESKIPFNRKQLNKTNLRAVGNFIDHINCNVADNRIQNLRMIKPL